jgi:hypothetical protein
VLDLGFACQGPSEHLLLSWVSQSAVRAMVLLILLSLLYPGIPFREAFYLLDLSYCMEYALLVERLAISNLTSLSLRLPIPSNTFLCSFNTADTSGSG